LNLPKPSLRAGIRPTGELLSCPPENESVDYKVNKAIFRVRDYDCTTVVIVLLSYEQESVHGAQPQFSGREFRQQECLGKFARNSMAAIRMVGLSGSARTGISAIQRKLLIYRAL
jgi:hypothetical protein